MIGVCRGMHNKSDTELMQLIREKNAEALEAIYDRYIKLVFSFALKSVGQEAEAREIVQLVFSRLWTTQSVYDPDKGRFINWLLTVTRNIAIDYLRKKRKYESVVRTDSVTLERITESSPDPSTAPDHWLLREHLQEATSMLNEAQKRLIQDVYWEGITLKEAAERYGEPLGTVKSRLHQTLKMLRRQLQVEREG